LRRQGAAVNHYRLGAQRRKAGQRVADVERDLVHQRVGQPQALDEQLKRRANF
jgi:hypothetical protein